MKSSAAVSFSLLIYTVTLFLSASLLFSVQPMVGKMILPLLGGTPNVWNTCMVFFQAVLLLGYCYAHTLKSLKPRYQFIIHLFLILAVMVFLPPRIPSNWVPPAASNPSLWLFALLSVSVGLPFFVISTSAPLLQKWFSNTTHPDAKDPYFLYAASNLGSLFALLSYPFLLEPAFNLDQQSGLWALGYKIFFLLALLCALSVALSMRSAPASSASAGDLGENSKDTLDKHISLKRRLKWIALSFVPSSLMLGVTTYITTDVSSVPMIWIIPLSLYLLSFILVFAKNQLLPRSLVNRSLAFLILPTSMTLLSSAPFAFSYLLIFSFHILAFFCIAMICHGALADNRPPTAHLTEFYLWISIGGVLGGLFNALLAPVLFENVTEYPLVIVMGCLLRPHLFPEFEKEKGVLYYIYPAVLLTVTIFGLYALTHLSSSDAASQSADLVKSNVQKVVYFCVPAFLCFVFRNNSIRFGLCIGTFFFCNFLLVRYFQEGQTRVFIDRGFFGVSQVWDDTTFRQYRHGSTVHGLQSLDPEEKGESLSYFHRTAPIGQIMSYVSRQKEFTRIGVLGLGVGSMASYGTSDQTWNFYEIDPIVEAIAMNPDYFTFLRDSPAKVNVLLGDGRLVIRDIEDGFYDLIVLDAFSSDSIPTHLITREAVELYLSKLSSRGFLVFNISNRFIDIRPILSSLAHKLDLVCYVKADLNVTEELAQRGKMPSSWAILARKDNAISAVAEESGWTKMTSYSKSTEWTDDYSNLLSVVNFVQL